MADRLKSVVSGSAADGFTKGWDPSKAVDSAYKASAIGKMREETEASQRKNAQQEAFRQAIGRGATIQELQQIAGADAELQSKLPHIHALRVFSDPNATMEQKDAAARAAGQTYGGTEGGTRFVQGAETKRTLGAASIAAQPAYQRNMFEHQDRGAKLAQDDRHWMLEPKPLYDPTTNTTRFAGQGELTSLPPGSAVPYDASVFNAQNAPASYSPGGGLPNMQVPRWQMNLSETPVPAPTPDAVLAQQTEPIKAVTPGSTQPVYFTKGDVARNPGVLSPPAEPGGEAAPRPSPANLPPQADWHAEQALRETLSAIAGQPGAFVLGDGGKAAPTELPQDVALKLPQLKTRILQYAQLNNLNFLDAANQVIQETYGKPGQGGLTIDIPGWGARLWASPTITPGQPVPPRPTAFTPEGHPIISQVPNRPGPTPAGPPQVIPGAQSGPTTAFVPPPKPTVAGGYRPGGSAPVSPPPPAPAPAQPPAPAQTPAPAPTTAQATPPAQANAHGARPNASNDAIVARAKSAIASGTDPKFVADRLRAWGIDPGMLASP